ncbi:MAG TPA: c-type cytochrome domain-containing protein [Bacteroidota bacterium]|nr:c-type cytochrome domain-containing protein [Bacteroidota bacterium]
MAGINGAKIRKHIFELSVREWQRAMIGVGCLALTLVMVGFRHQQEQRKDSTASGDSSALTYHKTILPIFKKYCLPCHTEDQMNPSHLYLDNYDDMMRGGKHGAPVIPGQPDSSLLVQKLQKTPPFGDPMPMKRKGQFPPDTLKIIRDWIKRGAKEN